MTSDLMDRHELLTELHRLLRPRAYLEVGVSTGMSLTLSRARTVGVDPFFRVEHDVDCDLQLHRVGSDEFFARPEPLSHLGPDGFDLAFIDGMHLSDYALRDFINAERHANPGSVVLLDDMLPRNHDEAVRRRATTRGSGAWTGDVYKVLGVLSRLRPDLTLVPLDTQPTGTVLIIGLDPTSEVLLDAYDDVVSELVSPDPQVVPQELLDRSIALDPAQVLASPTWRELVEARELPMERAREQVAQALSVLRSALQPA